MRAAGRLWVAQDKTQMQARAHKPAAAPAWAHGASVGAGSLCSHSVQLCTRISFTMLLN